MPQPPPPPLRSLALPPVVRIHPTRPRPPATRLTVLLAVGTEEVMAAVVDMVVVVVMDLHGVASY